MNIPCKIQFDDRTAAVKALIPVDIDTLEKTESGKPKPHEILRAVLNHIEQVYGKPAYNITMIANETPKQCTTSK